MHRDSGYWEKSQEGHCAKLLHLGLDLCGPFRVPGETADAKGYRYALVGVYTMPKLKGYRDYKILEEEDDEEDDGRGVGHVPVEEELGLLGGTRGEGAGSFSR